MIVCLALFSQKGVTMNDTKNSRRNFIKGVGLGAVVLGGPLLAASAIAGEKKAKACKTNGCDYDVIVIGGGNAGAAAARDSMKNGYKTLIIEAKNRLGGRTFTTDFEGTSIELGGFWIHPSQPFVWAEKERYNLEIKETPGAVPDVMTLLDNGKHIEFTLEQIYEAAEGWQIYHAQAREIIPRPWDILYNKEAALKADKINAIEHLNAIELTPLQKKFNEALISSMAHNHPDQISLLEVMRWHLCGGGYFPSFMDSITRFSLKDGTEALVKKMIEDGGADIRMSTTVKAVKDLGNKVEVTLVSGEKLTCGATINCLPMNTIGDIDYSPTLPKGVIEAGKERHTGAGVKVYIKVKGDVGNILSAANNHPISNVLTYKQAKDYTVLVAFGPSADILDVYDDEELQKALNDHIPGVEILSSMSYDWNQDPFAKGTYCSYKPGWVGKYYDQFQKDNGRILFGSSDHGEGWRGFIDGAIGGGILAAHRAKAILG